MSQPLRCAAPSSAFFLDRVPSCSLFLPAAQVFPWGLTGIFDTPLLRKIRFLQDLEPSSIRMSQWDGPPEKIQLHHVSPVRHLADHYFTCSDDRTVDRLYGAGARRNRDHDN